MNILFIHQEYPAQFGHLATYLAEQAGWNCTYLSRAPRARAGNVRRRTYVVKGGATLSTHFCSRTFENYCWNSESVLREVEAAQNLQPDLVVGHSGFGTTAFLADYLDCPIINYFEWYYHPYGAEGDFRPGEERSHNNVIRARARSAGILVDLQTSSAGYCPTHWQRSRFPVEYFPKLDVIFDGIDTSVWHRRHLPTSGNRVVAGVAIAPETKIVTYVARGFEKMRGFDVFMQASQRLCRRRKDIIFVCVGSDKVCYGNDLATIKEKSYREHVLSRDEYDLSRFIFTGRVPANELARILSLSDLHIYLTAPFATSWSLFNALACGAPVLGSATPPVEEVIAHGKNGMLAGFFDIDRLVEQALAILDDPAEARRLGQAGVETIHEKYSLHAVVPKFLDLFERTYRGSARGKYAPDPRVLKGAGWGVAKSDDVHTPAGAPASPIDRLAARFAWPAERPVVNSPPDHGWFGGDAKMLLQKSLDEQAALRLNVGETDRAMIVVELGAWLGLSTRWLAERVGQGKVITVDRFRGSAEHRKKFKSSALLPRLFEAFQAACWDQRGRIIPLKMLSPRGLRLVATYGVTPDVVFVDADHSYDSARANLLLTRVLFPLAPIVGDDWKRPGVRRAACEVAEVQGLEIEVRGNAWRVWAERK